GGEALLPHVVPVALHQLGVQVDGAGGLRARAVARVGLPPRQFGAGAGQGGAPRGEVDALSSPPPFDVVDAPAVRLGDVPALPLPRALDLAHAVLRGPPASQRGHSAEGARAAPPREAAPMLLAFQAGNTGSNPVGDIATSESFCWVDRSERIGTHRNLPARRHSPVTARGTGR